MNSITVLSVNCFHRWAICSARWHAGHFRRTLWRPSDLQPHHDSAERGRIPVRHTWICFQTYSVPLGVSERGSRQSIWQRDLHLSDISCTWPRTLRSQQQTSFYSKTKTKNGFSVHILRWRCWFYLKLLWKNLNGIFFFFYFELMKLLNITEKHKYKCKYKDL